MTASNKSPKTHKKSFSKFNLREAYQDLNLTHLLPWTVEYQPIPASTTFHEHLTKLGTYFNLDSSEEGKKLIIDAIFLEGIQTFRRLKIWKGARLEGDTAQGEADYLIAENKDYLEAPLLCVVEAKKDDFEQGLAQCLVEMKACHWNNRQLGKTIDLYGIITNGETWKFYQCTPQLQVYQTLPFAVGNLEIILGHLHVIFQACEHNL